MTKKTAKKKAAKQKEESHGGRRRGSGKPSWFRGKSSSSDDPMYAGIRNSASVRMTPPGWVILDAVVERLTAEAEKAGALPVSQATIFETLVRLYGKRLTLGDVRRAAAQG